MVAQAILESGWGNSTWQNKPIITLVLKQMPAGKGKLLPYLLQKFEMAFLEQRMQCLEPMTLQLQVY